MKKLLKFRKADTDFSSYQRDWEEFQQENNSITLDVLFVLHNNEEIKLAYKSIYNKRENQVILLMINGEANNCYTVNFFRKKFVRIKFLRMVTR